MSVVLGTAFGSNTLKGRERVMLLDGKQVAFFVMRYHVTVFAL